jgi:hypothetical protein
MNNNDEAFYADLQKDYPLFDYDNVRRYLEIYPLLTVTDFADGRSGDVLGDLRLIRGKHMNVVVLPNDEMVYVNTESLVNYDLQDKETLSRIVYSAHYEYSDFYKQKMPSFSDSQWWEVDYVSSTEALNTQLAIGGSTDFYERFHVWPHYPVQRSRKFLSDVTEFMPLQYLAEMIVGGRKAYIFYEVENSNYYGEAITDENNNPVAGPYAVLFEDSPPPEWISMEPLDKKRKNLPLASDVNRYVNATKLPYAPGWVHNDETPPAPYNYFLTQINAFDEAIYGEQGSLYVFWDRQHSAHIIIQSQ